jgi:hypothetical protein
MSIGNVTETKTIRFILTKHRTSVAEQIKCVYLTHVSEFDEQKSALQCLIPGKKYTYGGKQFLILLNNQAGVIVHLDNVDNLNVFQHNFGINGQLLQEVCLLPKPHELLRNKPYLFFEFSPVPLANPPGVLNYYGKYAPVKDVAQLKLYNDQVMKSHQQEEEEEEEEQEQCIICTENRSLVILLPCTHTGFCVQCTVKFTNATTTMKCPLCRHEIKEFQVFVLYFTLFIIRYSIYVSSSSSSSGSQHGIPKKKKFHTYRYRSQL